jgi:SAM-dependent methyltransferase
MTDKPRKTASSSKRKRSAPRAKPRSRYTAATADKHELYQMSVQDPAMEIAFVQRVFRKVYRRAALSLREDFCGTALFCAEWVRGREGRSAIGIDLDGPTLDWGIQRNLAPIGEPGKRIQLLQQNVLDPVPARSDITVALNFSYWVFTTREQMRDYFRGVRDSLNEEGLFVIDAYGGPFSMEAMEESEIERTPVKGGFTYVWDQHYFNAIDHSVTNHIHFEFRDGTSLQRAFTYHWRFWALPELRELLEEAGFSAVSCYWEDEDEDGDGTGVYRARKRADNEGAWVAYLIAER